MKKIGFLLFAIIFFLVPMVGNSLTLSDLPPVVHVQNLDEEAYDVEKEITQDKVIVSLKEKNGDLSYSWTFPRDEVGEELTLDFHLDFDSPYQRQIDALSKENTDKLYLSFEHHGQLPSEATIQVDVSDYYENGEKLYLYYYNEEKGQIEYIDHNLEVIDGKVSFTIDHCSEYFLTATIVTDAANNPKSMNVVIIILVGIIVVLIGATIFQTKK